MYDVVEVEGATGDVVVRDFTPEEAAAHTAALEELADLEAAQVAAAVEAADALASAEAKLAALGLTPDEVAAIAGRRP
jgi:predicted DNA-binding transcriptional regulator YafY